MKVKARLPGIYGNVNQPLPQAVPSGLTAINSRQLYINYYSIFFLSSYSIRLLMLQSKWGMWKAEDVYNSLDILLPAGHLHSMR